MTARQGRNVELMRLANSVFAPKSRFEEIYLAVATLFERQNNSFSGHERQLAADILRRLSKDVEMSIRTGLAERLAGEPEAPHELIILLADDKIEVARPILARSPVLSDRDLERLVANGSQAHQIAIAERPNIGETVTAALSRAACELAVIALLRNRTARIAPLTFTELGEQARQTPGLQGPLAERADLPPELVQSMFEWVSGALKTALSARYPQLAEPLVQAINETSAALQSDEVPVTAENAHKLVSKLHASGQLRASFLIRVLNQGQMELFDCAFARLLNMDIETLRKALYGSNPQTVALACRAAGIDRSVFTTVFRLSRLHRRVTAELSPADQKQIGAIFSQIKKTEALDRLKTAQA
jgi:uncharacterized protein (DUF2336 family)